MTSRHHRDNLGKVSVVVVKGPLILPIPVWEHLCHPPSKKSIVGPPEISPSSAGGAGSVPGQGAKIPHASWPKKTKA